MNGENKRITLKRVRPNPLFQEWLEELYEEAKETKSKLESMLKQALDSISKYPLPLQSGAECFVLKGFHKKLCIFLDKRLKVYIHNAALLEKQIASDTARNCISPILNINQNCSNGQEYQYNTSTAHLIGNSAPSNCDSLPDSDTIPQDAIVSEVITNTDVDNILTSKPRERRGSRKPRGHKYKPVYRSGGYAILIALFEASSECSEPLTKEILIEKAQRYSEESFIRPKPQTFYTAWSSMSKLISKGLVNKIRDEKVKYSLTEDGIKLAKELLEDNKNVPTVNDIIFNDKPSTSHIRENVVINNNEVGHSSSNICDSLIEMTADSFEIILLIDKNETSGLSKKNDPTVAQFNKYPDLKHEYRSLKVGDFTWIAQHKTNKDLEFVLPYVVERKRMDDLGASIKDGRFHEQKFRLRKCGLRNVIYLVEHYGNNKHVGLPIQSLMQALANTKVQDGFKVHITDSLTNSVKFLAMMTKRLTIRYKCKNLNGRNNALETNDNESLMTFKYFNTSALKTKALTVTEIFIKLLLQLKGLSVEKALAITDKYKTPRSLIVAYQRCDRSEGENLLANLKYGQMGRNVGSVVSKTIYQLFSCSGDT